MGIEELVLGFLQMQADLGAPFRIGRLGNGEFAAPVRAPAPAPLLAGLPGDHLDLVGDHEGGIEADAELADLADVALGVFFYRIDEGGGAGFGDGAEILDQLVAAHADAVIDDRQGPATLVGHQPDAEFAIPLQNGRIGQRLVAQLVAGVGSV